VIIGVEPVIGLHRDDIGAEAPRILHQRAGLDAKSLGCVAGGDRAGGIRRRLHDDDRLAAQGRVFAEILGLAGYSIIPALLPQFIEAVPRGNDQALFLHRIWSPIAYRLLASCYAQIGMVATSSRIRGRLPPESAYYPVWRVENSRAVPKLLREPGRSLALVVGAQPLRGHRALVVMRRIGQCDRSFGSIGHGVSPFRMVSR